MRRPNEHSTVPSGVTIGWAVKEDPTEAKRELTGSKGRPINTARWSAPVTFQYMGIYDG